MLDVASSSCPRSAVADDVTEPADAPPVLLVPLRTTSGMNAREQWQVRHRRVRGERRATAKVLDRYEVPPIPCSVLIIRVAPSGGLDDDNLRSALKGVRDEIADWLGVNDRNSSQVRYRYAQIRGPWSVRIQFWGPSSGAQFELFGEPVMAAPSAEEITS